MRFSESIVKNGTNAVKKYCEISGVQNENAMPEVFLGSQIAIGLHKDFGVNARTERYFTARAMEMGHLVDSELVNEMGGYRADVAVYESNKPTAIIEIKILSDGRSKASVLPT